MSFKKREQAKYPKKVIHKRKKKNQLLSLTILFVIITSGLIAIILTFYSNP